jgi:hypothetical protein
MNGTIYTVVGEKGGNSTKQRLQECIPGDGVHQQVHCNSAPFLESKTEARVQQKSTRHRRSPKSSPKAAKKVGTSLSPLIWASP